MTRKDGKCLGVLRLNTRDCNAGRPSSPAQFYSVGEPHLFSVLVGITEILGSHRYSSLYPKNFETQGSYDHLGSLRLLHAFLSHYLKGCTAMFLWLAIFVVYWIGNLSGDTPMVVFLKLTNERINSDWNINFECELECQKQCTGKSEKARSLYNSEFCTQYD